MSSAQLASEERLKEIELYEQQALKSLSLVHVDNPLLSKSAPHARERQGEVISALTSTIPEAIDLDSIVDLDDSNTQEGNDATANREFMFLNGEAQADAEAQTAIVTSDTANFPLYAESPGLIARPTFFSHSTIEMRSRLARPRSISSTKKTPHTTLFSNVTRCRFSRLQHTRISRLAAGATLQMMMRRMMSRQPI